MAGSCCSRAASPNWKMPRTARRRWRRARSRRVVDAARSGGARIFVPLRGPARHAHGRRGPERSGCDRASVRDAISRTSSYLLGEERHSRAVARAIVQRARRAPILTTKALADIVGRVVRRQARRHSSGDADVSGAAPVRQRRARRTGACAVRRRARAQAGRPAGRRVVPFARRPHREEVPRRAQRHARRLAPRAGSRRTRPRHFQVLTKRPVVAGRRGSRRQSARALGQAARGGTHRCARSAQHADMPLLPDLPSLDDSPARWPRMIIRMIHLIVVCLFVAAAIHVYKIKFDSTVQAERLAKLRPRSSASATRSPRCAPNGRSSIRRRASSS